MRIWFPRYLFSVTKGRDLSLVDGEKKAGGQALSFGKRTREASTWWQNRTPSRLFKHIKGNEPGDYKTFSLVILSRKRRTTRKDFRTRF